MPAVSVVYVTHRVTPRFEWFADSLAAQLGDDTPEVIFVDGLHTPERSEALETAVRKRFAFRHVPAKPTPWNGFHRLTRSEYFAAASARNTGIVCATGAYVVFVDDCSVLMPGWWEEARTAARYEYVVGGAYQKHRDMVVRDGVLVRSRVGPTDRGAHDHRSDLGDGEGIVRIGGGQLYGCSFGVPRALLLQVKGHDELCDPAGQVDCNLGIRLAWTGAPIFFSRRMLTIESVEGHAQPPRLPRLRKTLESSAYMERLAEFGVTHRSTDGDCDSLHMMLDITFGVRSFESTGNYYDLAELREEDFQSLPGRFPTHYWFDGEPLAEL